MNNLLSIPLSTVAANKSSVARPIKIRGGVRFDANEVTTGLNKQKGR
jgi:hypothetical protein